MKGEDQQNMKEDQSNNNNNNEQNNGWGYSQSNSRSHSHSSSHSHYSNYSKDNNPNIKSHSPHNEMENRDYQMNENEAQELHKNLKKEKGPDLDFLIVFTTPIQKILTEKKILQKISEEIGKITMEFDESFSIPEYQGVLLKIKGSSIQKKRDATQQLLEIIVENNFDLNQSNINSKNNLDKICIVIMIPNGLVSMVIGTRGKQISTLIQESHANIVINQPIYKMKYRTVSISGKPKNVSDAIMNIQQIMEERYNEVNDVKFECKPLNVKTANTNVKIIADEKIVNILTKKERDLIDALRNEHNVTLRIYQDKKNRQLKKEDWICQFQGTIQRVQAALVEVTKKIKHEIRSFYEGKKTYSLRMLINKVFVTKLIGAKGCMIQEIATFSKGASIKIMSNKYDEKKSSCHDIPVCIGGSFSSVQDASCIIIEQMECFKNGGPVLKSGKYLHDNIAVQFINSIFTEASPKQNEDDHIYTLKDRFLSEKRERDDTTNPNNIDQNVDLNELNNSNSVNNNNNINNNNSNNTNNNHHHHSSNKLDRRSSSNKSYQNQSTHNNNSMDNNDDRHGGYSRAMKHSSHNRNNSSNNYNNSNKYNNDRNNSHSRSRSNNRIHGHRRYSHNSRNNYSRSSSYSSGGGRGDRPKIFMKKNQPGDLTNNYSYDDKGVIKISMDIIVPDYLVNILIGRRGDNVRNIMSQTGSIINFSKEYNDEGKITTDKGMGRICNLKGTPEQNAMAMQMISENIIKFEQNKTGSNRQKK